MKSWIDQPEHFEATKPLLRFVTAGEARIIEIRYDAETAWAYVTVGNLFKSHTVRVPSLEDACRLAEAVKERKPGAFTLGELQRDFHATLV